MNKFLNLLDLLKLNSEDLNNLNRLITSNKIEAVIKSLCKEKPRARWIHYLILLNSQGSSNTSNCLQNTAKFII